jgi:peptidoglycan/LPS O-acetylase OafA/YrhL
MRKLQTSHLTLIHGIRGICSLIVAITHCKFFFWVGGVEFVRQHPMSSWGLFDYLLFGLDLSTSNGTAMVVVFFLLSGFFIAFTFRRNKWTRLNFYKVRFMRIYIPFIFSLLLSTAVFYVVFIYGRVPVRSGEITDLVTQTKASFTPGSFFRTLFFIRNEKGLYMGMNFPYWSLFHEAIFYLLAPFLLLRLRLSLGISFVLYLAGFFFKQQNMLLDFIFHYFFYFNVGMMLYDRLATGPMLQVSKWNWIGIVGIFMAGLVANYVVGYRLSFLIASIATAWAIHQIIYGEVREFFLLRILRYLGKISYTLYLFHIPLYITIIGLLYAAGIFLNPYGRSYYLVALTIVLLCIPLYKLIEERSIVFIQKFRGKKREAAPESGKVQISEA